MSKSRVTPPAQNQRLQVNNDIKLEAEADLIGATASQRNCLHRKASAARIDICRKCRIRGETKKIKN